VVLAAALLTRVGRVADLAFKWLTADAAEPCGKEPISGRIRLTVPTPAALVKASLASSFGSAGRAGDKQLHQLSVAFALLVKSATAKHPHLGGSTAENCAAWGSRRWVTRLDMLGR
jgi:hypothetical protein